MSGSHFAVFETYLEGTKSRLSIIHFLFTNWSRIRPIVKKNKGVPEKRLL